MQKVFLVLKALPAFWNVNCIFTFVHRTALPSLVITAKQILTNVSYAKHKSSSMFYNYDTQNLSQWFSI